MYKRQVDTTEKHLDEVLNELKNVREELNTIHNKSIKDTALKAVNTITDKVNQAKQTIIKFKDHVKSTVDKALHECKAKGKEALTLSLIHIYGQVTESVAEIMFTRDISSAKDMETEETYILLSGEEIEELQNKKHPQGNVSAG